MMVMVAGSVGAAPPPGCSLPPARRRLHYSWLAGLVVSGVVYWTLSRSLDRAREQAAIDVSDQELKELAGSERVQGRGGAWTERGTR
jgi:cytosine/uracil/thiamine/allantoin permease